MISFSAESEDRANMPTKVLVAYDANSTHVQTTLDYLRAVYRSTNYDVEYVHVIQGAVIDFDFSPYDVVFHNYCARLCFEGYVSASYRAALRVFRGLKVLAVQDEYDETNRLKEAILDLRFDIVLTCVPQASIEYVYPSREFSHIKFITVYTGYAPDDAASLQAPIKPLKDRRVILGYRGRDIGGRYGQLAFDKYEIGRRMKELCIERGITHDIAMDAKSRIYGLAWFDFLGDCRAMLGTESGSNVFDFDGSIMKSFRELSGSLGRPANCEEFAKAEPVVAVRERGINMAQISPRVFECAMMRTPMVLFEGGYSGVIEPHEHYVPLRKDFSNAVEVLERLQDIEALEAMTERAYRHLIASDRFTYRAFWRRLGSVIAESLKSLPARDRVCESALQNNPRLTDKSHLVERPTRDPLGLAHIEMQTARGDLDVWIGEVQRLDGIFRDSIERSIEYANRLCKLLRECSPNAAKQPQITTIDDGVAGLAADGHRILANQSAYVEQAEGMRAEWMELPQPEVALQKLQELVAIHRRRAADYEREYERFNVLYMETSDALQQAIAEAARPIERQTKVRSAEVLKALVRAAQSLIRFIRSLRGADNAA
jgi:hypothetical protein